MGVTKCRMLVTHKGQTAHYDVDLLMEPDQPPTAVLQWADYPDGTNIPRVAVQLEPGYLHEIPGWGEVTHMYELPIESPMPPR